MPYPAKTSAQTILNAAIDHLEQYGEESLSMRELASGLGLTPRALYRYYPDRAALEAAIAQEGFQRLRSTLANAVQNRVGHDALREAATAYLAFAQAHPALYGLLMRSHEQTAGLMQAEHAMWDFVLRVVGSTVGETVAASAAVALWAFLHGFIALERAAILGDQKPRSGFSVGLEVFLAGLASVSRGDTG
jgi:AcrR family transcriptional regulator